jgi:hypothetical protein
MTQANTKSNAKDSQASICFCINEDAPKMPTVDLQLLDLTKTFRA